MFKHYFIFIILVLSIMMNMFVPLGANVKAIGATYTFSVSGSTITVINGVGSTVATGSDFGSVFNTVNTLISSGDTIKLDSGIYLASTLSVLSKSNILVEGVSGSSIIKATSTSTPSNMLFESDASYDTIKNIVFDCNHNTLISPAILLDDYSYQTVQGCGFINTYQYCLETYSANHFYIYNNTIQTAQYGICTAGQSTSYSNDGIVSYNTISDCSNNGIKIKWTKNTLFEYNNIDTNQVTGFGLYGGSDFTPSGICFYSLDGPVNNVTATHNYITDSGFSPHTAGIMVDPSGSPSSTQENIINNQFSELYYAIFNRGTDVTITGNNWIGCTNTIVNDGAGTIMSDNQIGSGSPGSYGATGSGGGGSGNTTLVSVPVGSGSISPTPGLVSNTTTYTATPSKNATFVDWQTVTDVHGVVTGNSTSTNSTVMVSPSNSANVTVIPKFTFNAENNRIENDTGSDDPVVPAQQEVQNGFIESARVIMEIIPIMAIFGGVGIIKSGKFDSETVIGYAIVAVVIILVSSIFL